MNDRDTTRETRFTGGTGGSFTEQDIRQGMDVCDSSGDKIGTIDKVFSDAPSVVGTYDTGTSAATGSSGWQSRYFKVGEAGALHMGIINAKTLYIPFSAVRSVDRNDNRVILDASKKDLENRYSDKPDFLPDNS